MNIQNILSSLMNKEKTNTKEQKDYNLSQNYYPKEAFPTDIPEQSQQNNSAIDINSILPLLSKMNGGEMPNIASLLSKQGNSNPLQNIASILGTKKDNKNNDDINKNSQLRIENFKKISDFDD